MVRMPGDAPGATVPAELSTLPLIVPVPVSVPPPMLKAPKVEVPLRMLAVPPPPTSSVAALALTLVKSATGPAPPTTWSVPVPLIVVALNAALVPCLSDTHNVPPEPISTVPAMLWPFCIESNLLAAMFRLPVLALVNAASHEVLLLIFIVPALFTIPPCTDGSLVNDQPAVELTFSTPLAALLNVA